MELVALVGGYTCPLSPTVSEDVQVGSNTLASPPGYIKPGAKLTG